MNGYTALLRRASSGALSRLPGVRRYASDAVMSCFNPELMKGKVVFVTGGGSGINLGIAKTFAFLGASVAICGRTPEKLQNAVKELEALGAQALGVPADVRDYAALEAAFDATQQKLGPIHTLVAGAAGNFICSAERLTANGFKTVVDIDLLGSFNAAHAALPQLKVTRGNIIFVSAGQGLIPYTHQAHAGAAKAGIENLMKNLAVEWGSYHIRSNSIVPGPIEDTEGMRRLAPGDAKNRESMKRAVPMGRFGTVYEIGQAAAFLASPLASYVTGTTLVVDGGMNLPGSGLMSQIMAQMADPQKQEWTEDGKGTPF